MVNFSDNDDNNNIKITIILCTFNGEKYIKDQLESIKNQTIKNFSIIISDDGSTDNTLNIIKAEEELWTAGKIVIRHGPQRGYAENFLQVINDPTLDGDFFAFCDQDDVWFENKLEKAISVLRCNNASLPLLYCGRTAYVRDDLKIYGYSPLFKRPASFRNAIFQSIAGGNTMVMNRKAKLLLQAAGVTDVVAHDWWAYMLVSGAGGFVCYDSEPYIYYRQHPDAIMGENNSFSSKLSRIIRLFKGEFKVWNSKNLIALNKNRDLLSSDALQVLDIINKLRSKKLKERIFLLKINGIYRQTLFGTISLWVANLINKI